jgi:virulence-associated protein VagC
MFMPKTLEIRGENVKTVIEPIKTKTETHEMEPNRSKDKAKHEGDNPSFLDEFLKFAFVLIFQFIFVF